MVKEMRTEKCVKNIMGTDDFGDAGIHGKTQLK
jgi:hypothetical protein